MMTSYLKLSILNQQAVKHHKITPLFSTETMVIKSTIKHFKVKIHTKYDKSMSLKFCRHHHKDQRAIPAHYKILYNN